MLEKYGVNQEKERRCQSCGAPMQTYDKKCGECEEEELRATEKHRDRKANR